MINLNKVLIAGRLSAIHPKKASNNLTIQDVDILIEEDYFNTQTQQEEHKKETLKITFFGKLADQVLGIPVGSIIIVEGKIKTNSYRAQNGTEYQNTSVIGVRFSFHASANKATAQQNNRSYQSYSAPEQEQQPITQQVDLNDFDDDIPF